MAMKEHQVKGLVELKTGFEARLAENAEYQHLADELREAALALVHETVKAKGIVLNEVPILTLRPKKCLFCTACVTDCVSCVFHAPS
jgi:hypothetical protein